MGNTCVGPNLGNRGFIESVTAAVWRTQAPNNRLPPAPPPSSDGGKSNAASEPSKVPDNLQSVQSIPPKPEKMPAEGQNPTQGGKRSAEPEMPKDTRRPAGSMKRIASAGLQVDSVLGRKTGNMKDIYTLGRKLENFLFTDHEEDAELKTIDFGLSVFFRPGETFTDVVGSPYYVAPEVLKKHYGPECDVWSVGVIVYILLCGVPPFWDESEQGIFEQVLGGELDMVSEPWPSISQSAKDLVRRMLIRDPKKRITAHEVLCHPWVQVDGVAPDKPLDPAVLSRLKQFSAMAKLKKIAIRVIADILSEEEIAGLKGMFEMIDTDNSGSITLEELKKGLEKVGANLKDTEISGLMQAADMDNSGTIDYGEFIAAMLHLNKVQKEDHLVAAFSYFDKDGSGYITKEELQQACAQFGLDDEQLEKLIREVDQDNDGLIDYSEFVAMMQDGGFDNIRVPT
ncbi:hypothetical protein MLD38_020284 [Melastoma candidum]|uniref:Uncharacterized protein n=1 Tax=Melastoma candidum TaxID=119954 RepID=A0ACB9QCG3_9MYRT|nr:hypothetical protein MLD38_020284 [Melastoma candidum]